jgi:predicted ATPase/DNA-binding NarL/FixJ family response regulator
MSEHKVLQQTTPFIGRINEIADIIDRLNDPNCRLLTLVGPGGIGKTRLAIEVMSHPLLQFVDDPFFVELQPITSVDNIVPAIVDAVDLDLIDGSDPAAELLDYLAQKEILLVLDNFENLMSGVGLLTDILSAAPQVKLLITSRERLLLREEWVIDVGGLAVPEDDHFETLEMYSASQLFLECVQRTGYKILAKEAIHIASICRLVEGIPLAIELSASWIRSLLVEEIAHEIEQGLDILTTSIRNFPEKHRSMRVVFSHSWAQLSAEEQAIFRKLSVFQGGFRRKAAEQVAGASLIILASLVDRSMLRIDETGRYSLQELLRQFGAEQLNELPQEASQTKDHHCKYYAEFMEKQWLQLTGSEIKGALINISTELDNVRIAWDWAVKYLKTAEVEAALNSLWFYYGVSGRSQEGENVFGKAVPAFKEHKRVYGKLMGRWGELSSVAGSPERANTLMKESLRLLRQVDERNEFAFPLHRLVMLDLYCSVPLPEITEYLEESLSIYTELNEHYWIGQVLSAWGDFHLTQHLEQNRQGALELAQQYTHEASIAYQKRESLFGIANTHAQMSNIAGMLADYRLSLEYAQTSRAIFQELGIGWGIIRSLVQVGYAAYKVGDYAEARQCVLQNLLFNLERELNRKQYGAHFIPEIILNTLHLFSAILIKEKQSKRAYEILAFVKQQCIHFQIQADRSKFFLLHLLDEDMSPQLTEAVERGRAFDLETIVKEVIAEISTTSSNADPMMESRDDLLTDREIEIIRLIAEGLNSREVAEKIHLGVTTVRWYLRQIYSKLDVHSRAELIARAKKLKLLA